MARNFLRSFGPTIIVASVVLGPGSILSASKSGQQFGYAMTWALAIAVILMIGMTALSARLAVFLDGTLCTELAERGGRFLAFLTGGTIFLIAACFQFGNNLGILAAVEPFLDDHPETFKWLGAGIIVSLNVVVIVAVYKLRALYQSVETAMKVMVGLMLLAFAGNLLFAQPDVRALLAGLIPSIPSEEDLVTKLDPTKATHVVDQLAPVIALFATTFSIGGAFYQSYLVRQKGWTREHLREGFIDSTVGILVLGGMTLMIMVTAAAVLHGKDVELRSAADVARQLEPLFGTGAKALFCLGILAGALSSFLVNAMTGGSLLADGLGVGRYLDDLAVKHFTTVGLLMGMVVALYTLLAGERPVDLIILAQTLTILGLPLVAGAMLYLATRADLREQKAIPNWMVLVAWVSFIVVVLLAIRTAVRIF